MAKTKTLVDQAVAAYNSLGMYERHMERAERELHAIMRTMPIEDMAEYVTRTTKPEDKPQPKQHQFKAMFFHGISTTTCDDCELDMTNEVHI